MIVHFRRPQAPICGFTFCMLGHKLSKTAVHTDCTSQGSTTTTRMSRPLNASPFANCRRGCSGCNMLNPVSARFCSRTTVTGAAAKQASGGNARGCGDADDGGWHGRRRHFFCAACCQASGELGCQHPGGGPAVLHSCFSLLSCYMHRSETQWLLLGFCLQVESASVDVSHISTSVPR